MYLDPGPDFQILNPETGPKSGILGRVEPWARLSYGKVWVLILRAYPLWTLDIRIRSETVGPKVNEILE